MFETYTPLPSTAVQLHREPADPDQALVHQWVHRGDANALAGLLNRHRAYVFRLALSVLGPGFEADAEDVAQEAFIKVAERLREFRGECRFLTWLHRLALNIALDRRRRPRWYRPHVELEVLDRRPDAANGCDPFTAADEVERAQMLHRCLEQLPGSLRAVVHLRFWFDLSIEQIAATLNLPIGTVKSNLHRARTLLVRAMEATERGCAAGSVSR